MNEIYYKKKKIKLPFPDADYSSDPFGMENVKNPFSGQSIAMPKFAVAVYDVTIRLMKQKIITLKITKAKPSQLLTLACELRIMARAWEKFGPQIEVQAGKLKEIKQYQKNIKKW